MRVTTAMMRARQRAAFAKRVIRFAPIPKKPRNKRPRVSKKVGQATVYRYTRFSNDSVTQTIDTTEFLGYAQFSLSDVKSYTDFTNLYDQFMISHAQVHFTLINNPDAAFALGATANVNVNDAGAKINATNWFPKIWWVYDSDDSTTISLSAMKERQGVKCTSLSPYKTVIMNVKPKALIQTYRTNTTTGYAPKRMFLDCATGYNVPHYGLKYVIDTLGVDPNDTYPFKVRVEVKYWLRFKGVM